MLPCIAVVAIEHGFEHLETAKRVEPVEGSWFHLARGAQGEGEEQNCAHPESVSKSRRPETNSVDVVQSGRLLDSNSRLQHPIRPTMHIHTLGEIDSRMLRLSHSWRLSKLLTEKARLERELLRLWDIREGLEPWTGRVNIPIGIAWPHELNALRC